MSVHPFDQYADLVARATATAARSQADERSFEDDVETSLARAQRNVTETLSNVGARYRSLTERTLMSGDVARVSEDEASPAAMAEAATTLNNAAAEFEALAEAVPMCLRVQDLRTRYIDFDPFVDWTRQVEAATVQAAELVLTGDVVRIRQAATAMRTSLAAFDRIDTKLVGAINTVRSEVQMHETALTTASDLATNERKATTTAGIKVAGMSLAGGVGAAVVGFVVGGFIALFRSAVTVGEGARSTAVLLGVIGLVVAGIIGWWRNMRPLQKRRAQADKDAADARTHIGALQDKLEVLNDHRTRLHAAPATTQTAHAPVAHAAVTSASVGPDSASAGAASEGSVGALKVPAASQETQLANQSTIAADADSQDEPVVDNAEAIAAELAAELGLE